MATVNDAIAVSSSSSEHLTTPLLPTSETTVAGAVDYTRRRPAIRSKHGRWRSASFILVVEIGERFVFFGMSSNMITFLTEELGLSTATAAANVNAWTGAACLLPVLGGILADSFFGKYYAILASSCIYILGMFLLTLSAMLPSLSSNSNERSLETAPGYPPLLKTLTFFVGLYLVGVGEGGFRPCVQAFGADQFDRDDPEESKAKGSFFNWWYCGLCLGAILGIAVVSYIQDNLNWSLAFGILSAIVMVAFIVFLCGTMTYRYTKKREGQTAFKRIGRVFIAALRNQHASDCSAVLDDQEEAFRGLPNNGSHQYGFLDKALLPPNMSKGDGQPCSIDDVEEAKSVLRLFPIWVTSLIFAVAIAQHGTLFTRQGATLDRSIGSSFVVPAASLQCFSFICIIVFTPVYDRVFVPVTRAFTGKPAGITTLQRIGIGLFISIVCMVIAALIEKQRLQTALEHGLIDLPGVTIPMSIWWLVPQYALFGIADSFTLVGLQEFFYDQVPNDLRSVGLSLYLSVVGVGSILSGLLVSGIDKATSGGGRESWFSNNLNHAHLDYFYWLISGLSALNLALFVLCAKSYKYKNSTGP